MEGGTDVQSNGGTSFLPVNPPNSHSTSNGSNGFKNGETSRLVALAQTIARETEKVDAYLRDHPEGGYPSFEEDGPVDFPPLSEDVKKSRSAIIEATTELKDLVVGPTENLRWQGWNVSPPQ